MKIKIGYGSCGIAAGAKKIKEVLEKQVREKYPEHTVEITGCNGMCFAEPLVEVIDESNSYLYGRVTSAGVDEILAAHAAKKTAENFLVKADEMEFIKKQTRLTLRNCGIVNPESLADYQTRGGYQAFKKVLNKSTPEAVIAEVKKSNLGGRGGAGFPTWFKWEAARKAKGNLKYVICNADEGDPGAFMDRSLLESDPHNVLEGMMIAGFAIGAAEAIIYVRAEYPLAVKRLQIAIKQLREAGLLGKDILGSGFDYDFTIKEGAGAFVCGEETALIASLEGERGMPRLKPPFPAEKGYWNKPSNINNVETYANISWIIDQGGEAFSRYGTEKSSGTKIFALAGKVRRGGLVEVPMGITLHEVIFGIAGGIKEDKDIKGVQMGGPSGGCIPKRLLDTPIDYESITATGAIMGSGGMVVMDETTCMVDVARYFLDFTQKESCGKCVYCRIGTKRMLEILTRITEGKGQDGDIELLQDLADKIQAGSLCGLGISAPNPVLTTIRYFLDEYKAHIYEHRCPAKQCKSLLKYEIIAEKCVGCTACQRQCPTQAITGQPKHVHEINQELCIKCGKCYDVCRFDAIKFE